MKSRQFILTHDKSDIKPAVDSEPKRKHVVSLVVHRVFSLSSEPSSGHRGNWSDKTGEAV